MFSLYWRSLRQGPWLWFWALAILAMGTFLRFDDLAGPSLWLDEILHVEKTHDLLEEPWYRWFTSSSIDRENGALYYAGQAVALVLFDGEFAARFVPAVAGVATLAALLLATLAASDNRRAAPVAAALLAVSPLHVYYSREGRPYAAVMLIAVLLLLVALESRRAWTRPLAYGLCLAAAYLGAVAAPVLIACACLATFEWLRKRRCAHLALAAFSGLVISFLLFPEVKLVAGVVGTGKYVARTEITEPLSAVAFDRLLASLSVSGLDRGTSNGLSFLFLALALWGGISLARKDLDKALWVAGMWLLPIAASFAALVTANHWYNVRYTSAGLPAFLILVSIGWVDIFDRLWRLLSRRWQEKRPNWHPWLAGGLLAASLTPLLSANWRTARTEPTEKPNWRGLAELISSLAAPDEPVIARDRWSETCIGHYLGQPSRRDRPIEVFSANLDVAEVRRLTAIYPRAWVVAAGYRTTDDFQGWLHGLDPVLESPLANLKLFFFPDFGAFLSGQQRANNLLPALATIGEPAARQDFTESSFLLGSGWSNAETDPDGLSFRWATSQGQVALLTTPVARAKTLQLRLRPFPSPDKPPQSVAVRVNSRLVSQVILEPGWNEISLPFDSGASPVDLVTFEFSWYQSASEIDPASTDTRPLAAAFDFVQIITDSADSGTNAAVD